MAQNKLLNNDKFDVLIVGAGVSGLTTAIVAAKRGLKVAVIEKASVFGGTAAFSGGVLWIPGNYIAKQAGIKDSKEEALKYIQHETNNQYDEEVINKFLDTAPEMVEYFEKETEVRFVSSLYPDYHPDQIGAAQIGRSITAEPYDITALGKEMGRLRPPLKTITFIGMMFNSSSPDIKHFFNATKSLKSFIYVVKRLSKHLRELLIYKKGINVTSGNALMARLAKSTLDVGVPIFTETAFLQFIENDGRVVGAVVKQNGEKLNIFAEKALVLASGGFPHDEARLKTTYPHVSNGGHHLSPTPKENTGDGVRAAEELGAKLDMNFINASAWIPVSKVPYADGTFGIFPHLVDRYKPGMIGVNKEGRRFTNESNSYHDVGQAMIKDCASRSDTEMWLVCDHPTIRKYGLGYAKPAPVPLGPMLKRGYILKGNTLAELAKKAGIDPKGLEETVKNFNRGAVNGEDPEFKRGSTAFNRYLGDAEHKPNPCVAPILKGPFYALRIVMGDLGTFDGIRTDLNGQVLNNAGEKIPGLYAVGNDRSSIFSGNYIAAGITLGPNMTFSYITANYIADNK